MAQAQIDFVKVDTADKILFHNYTFIEECNTVFGWLDVKKASIYREIYVEKTDLKKLFPQDRRTYKKYKVPKDLFKEKNSTLTNIEIIRQGKLTVLHLRKT